MLNMFFFAFWSNVISFNIIKPQNYKVIYLMEIISKNSRLNGSQKGLGTEFLVQSGYYQSYGVTDVFRIQSNI